MMRAILGIVLILALGTVIMAEEAFDVTKIDKYMQVGKADETGLAWLDPWEAPFQLSGMYRFCEEKKFQRIPNEKMDGLRPGLLSLAKCTTGFQLRFKSNTTRINLAVSVPNCKPSTLQAQAGQRGFDLYVDGVYWNLTQVAENMNPYKFEIFNSAKAKMREFVLNFPLYNGVNYLRIGIDENAKVEAPAPRAISKPVVIYGTSITQGGAASRPGMAFTNIISRKLNIDILNFGFAGMGQNEQKMVEILAEIKEPAMYIIDSEANSISSEKVNERVPVFLDILRKAHPNVPILVLSKVKYGPRYGSQIPILKEDFRKIVERRRQAGDKNIHFLDGSDFFGPDDEYFECTTDSAHPNDLGFYRMAKAITPVVKKLLKL